MATGGRWWRTHGAICGRLLRTCNASNAGALFGQAVRCTHGAQHSANGMILRERAHSKWFTANKTRRVRTGQEKLAIRSLEPRRIFSEIGRNTPLEFGV